MGIITKLLGVDKMKAELSEQHTQQIEQVKSELITHHAQELDLVKANYAKKELELTELKGVIYDPFANSLQNWVEKPSEVSFEHLLVMSNKNTIIRSIIQTRKNQIGEFSVLQKDKHSTGFAFRRRDNKPLDKDDKREINKLTDFLLQGGEEPIDDFETFLRKITEDTLVYDQVTIEKAFTRGKELWGWRLLDAKTIRRAITPNMSAEDVSRGHVPVAYAQLVNGAVKQKFSKDELLFAVRNPRTDIYANGYGFSELEMLIHTVTAHLFAEAYNRKFFTLGSAPKGMFVFYGNISQEHLEAFRRQWTAQIRSVTNAWHTPAVSLPPKDSGGGVEYIQLQKTNEEMGYGKWMEYLIKIMTAIYQIDPAEINFDLKGGYDGGKSMFESNNAAKIKMSKDKGLKPLLRFIEGVINKLLVLKNPRYVFEFVGLEAQTPGDMLDLQKKELDTYKTFNEIRKDNALPPIAGGDIIGNPNFLQAKMQDALAQQQAEPSEADKEAEDIDLDSLLKMTTGGAEDVEKSVRAQIRQKHVIPIIRNHPASGNRNIVSLRKTYAVKPNIV